MKITFNLFGVDSSSLTPLLERDAFNPDQPRDDHGRWGSGGAGYKLTADFRDYHSGDNYGSIYAEDKDGNRVGHLDFIGNKNRVLIAHVGVDPAHARKGLATAMIDELVGNQFKGAELEWGMTTPDGTALRKAWEKLHPAPRHASLRSRTGERVRAYNLDPENRQHERSPYIPYAHDAFDPDQPRNEKGEWSSGGAGGNRVTAYHGTVAAINRFSELGEAHEDYMPDRMLGYHFAKDPAVSNSFVMERVNMQEHGAKAGGHIIPVSLPPEETFLEVPQPQYEWAKKDGQARNNRNIETDQTAVTKMIAAVAYPKRPDILTNFLTNARNQKPDEAKANAEALIAGKTIDLPGDGLHDLARVISNFTGAMPYDQGAKSELVRTARGVWQAQGYKGLKYINTSPMETMEEAGVKDPTAYIVFDPKDVKGLYTGDAFDPGQPRDETGKWIGGAITAFHGTGQDKPHSQWFTTHRGQAEDYARTSAETFGGTAKVLSADLDIKNPHIVPSDTAEWLPYEKEQVAALRAKGHDVIMNESGHEIFVLDPSIVHWHGVKDAFNPNQPRDPSGKWEGGSNWSLPPAPGTAPIPMGHVRLFHQTSEDKLGAIKRNGLTLSSAKGIEGPRAIYADEKGFYGEPSRIPTVEFHVPVERWNPPFVRADSELDQGRVAPENIIAIHRPWHAHARYAEADPDLVKGIVAGEHDALLGDREYGKTIRYIKHKYGAVHDFDPSQERDERGRWTAGALAPGESAWASERKKFDHPAFKKWFGSSKVVDRDGWPLTVYHGSLSATFHTEGRKGNPEGNFGAGVYFTNSSDDASENYARAEGPDQKNRIEMRAEQIQSENNIDYDEAKEQAFKEIAQIQGAMVPAYLKIEKPYVIGDEDIDVKDTFLDLEEPYDEKEDEYGEPTGELVDFIQALKTRAAVHEYGVGNFHKSATDGVIGKIMDEALGNGGISSSKLDEIIRSDENFGYIEDREGRFVSAEVYRQALEDAGFDGVIDHSVMTRFQGMGLDPGTTHYIVFRPQQIKSSIGNKGTFDPDKPGIIDAARRAAGVLFVTPDGLGLFMLRQGGDHSDEWALPAGRIEAGERPCDAAARETVEEAGWPVTGLSEKDEVDKRVVDGTEFHTFLRRTERFAPILNVEHSDFMWALLDHPPEPLHRGMKAILGKIRTRQVDRAL